MHEKFVNPPQLQYYTVNERLSHRSYSTVELAVENSDFLIVEESNGQWKNGEYLNTLKKYRLLDQQGKELPELVTGNWAITNIFTYRDCTRFPSDYYYNFKLVGGTIRDQFGHVLEEKEYPVMKGENLLINYDGLNGIKTYLMILIRLQEFKSVQDYLNKGGRALYSQTTKSSKQIFTYAGIYRVS